MTWWGGGGGKENVGVYSGGNRYGHYLIELRCRKTHRAGCEGGGRKMRVRWDAYRWGLLMQS